LKILHLIYTNGVSGAEKYLLNLLPALNKIGTNCELICICPKENGISLLAYCRQMNDNKVKATLLTTTSKISFLNIARKIGGYLKTNNIHIIHSHLFSADFIGVFIKKLYYKKLIILSTKHGYEEEYLIQYGLGNKKIRYNPYYFIARYVINKIDYNLTVSLALSKLYVHLKLGKEKMPYIHHGINLQFSNEENIQFTGDPKILMVGRLSVIKGHTYLIQALPEIVQKFPKIKLILVGDGPLRDELIKQANILNVRNHIEFAGFDKPQNYTKQCQVMVLPSLFESFGLVYIESFALKIPVIAFDAEAGNEIIENNKTGILVPKEDIKALAEKIIYLLESPLECHRIVENAYNKYLTYYNVERMAKQTLEWYHSVLKED